MVLVRDRVPGATPSLDAVRDDVARRVFQERRNAEVDALAATLRAAAEIEVFADGEKLRALLMKSASAGTAAR